MIRLRHATLTAVLALAAGCGTAPTETHEPAPAAAVAAAEPAAPAAPTAPVAPSVPATPVAPAPPAPPVAEAPVEHPAPDFSLPDPDGVSHALADYRGKWVVLEWTNHGCPYVKRHYGNRNMQTLQARYTGKGVVWLTICSSAPGKEGNQSPAQWKATLAEKGAVPTAMLLDPAGSVGHAYGAKTTPHMFVIDPRGGIVYRGAIDDKRSAKLTDVAEHTYVAEVLDAVLDGKPAPVSETKPYG